MGDRKTLYGVETSTYALNLLENAFPSTHHSQYSLMFKEQCVSNNINDTGNCFETRQSTCDENNNVENVEHVDEYVGNIKSSYKITTPVDERSCIHECTVKDECLHSKVEYTKVELLPCLICAVSYGNRSDVLKHMNKIHHMTNLCKICYFEEGQLKRFANPVSLRNHKLRDHPEDMVKCICGAMLIDNKMLSSHLKKFKCDQKGSVGDCSGMIRCICGKRFASVEQVIGHQAKCRKRDLLGTLSSNAKPGSVFGIKSKPTNTDVNNNKSTSDSDVSLQYYYENSRSACKKNKEMSQTCNDAFERLMHENDTEFCKHISRLVPRTGIPQKFAKRKISPFHTEFSADSVKKTKSDLNNNFHSMPVEKNTRGSVTTNTSPKGEHSGTIQSVKKLVPSSDTYTSPTIYKPRFNGRGYLLLDNLSMEMEASEADLIKKHPEESSVFNNPDMYEISSQLKSDSSSTSKATKVDKELSISSPLTRRSGVVTSISAKLQIRNLGKKTYSDMRYPCKTCGRRFKKPYLYVHQRLKHKFSQTI
ncbi:uncharacterized protein LOC127839142 [Dreissena polymorpha]|uniref:C2H2-type domain-containing protein n=1 Tax=Dreissena polymorpha TaxID=45954 RepID=A0A9D4FE07_DREPO|nr:uncharacterized protein LOC127839142 [Dreissena polymorpha]KAH3794895.1 hypothetical protein DPMN_148434 [Dreissena polymorpha]